MRIFGVVENLLLLVALILLGLVAVPLSLAQVPQGRAHDGALAAEAAILDDLATVVAYREAVELFRGQVVAARKVIVAKEEFLAQALGATGVKYSEQKVRVAHAELMVAMQKFEAIELESFLVYKKYHPEWQPEVSSKGVVIPRGKSVK